MVELRDRIVEFRTQSASRVRQPKLRAFDNFTRFAPLAATNHNAQRHPEDGGRDRHPESGQHTPYHVRVIAEAASHERERDSQGNQGVKKPEVYTCPRGVEPGGGQLVSQTLYA